MKHNKSPEEYILDNIFAYRFGLNEITEEDVRVAKNLQGLGYNLHEIAVASNVNYYDLIDAVNAK